MSFKVENILESLSADKAKYITVPKKNILSKISNYTQVIPSSSNTRISWWTTDTDNSIGDTELSISHVEGRFTNTSTHQTNVYSIDGYIGWNIGATFSTVRNCFIVKNGNIASNQGRIGYTSVQCSTATAFPVTNFHGTVILQPGEFFEIYVYHNDSSSQNINDEHNFPGSRLTIIKL